FLTMENDIYRNLRIMAFILLAAATGAAVLPADGYARRVRQSLKVTSTSSSSKGGKKKSDSQPKDSDTTAGVKWIKVTPDSCTLIPAGADSTLLFDPKSVSFAGYDKQATSRTETFHVVNRSGAGLRKVKLRIIYKDMKGRMLHSRDVAAYCNVPPGETRKIDIPTWDKQFSFYYHLGNEPRRVATPYKVEIQPLIFWLSPNR
ncbi:MAG: hypothetical protein K2H15_00315, partial [Muribaculaceae bacterium]|nr:hypothetical protein [Muribaculaceae bacterium]